MDVDVCVCMCVCARTLSTHWRLQRSATWGIKSGMTLWPVHQKVEAAAAFRTAGGWWQLMDLPTSLLSVRGKNPKISPRPVIFRLCRGRQDCHLLFYSDDLYSLTWSELLCCLQLKESRAFNSQNSYWSETWNCPLHSPNGQDEEEHHGSLPRLLWDICLL